MKDKFLDIEKRCNVLRHIRRHVKKSIFLFPPNTSAHKMLQRMSDELKKEINILEKENKNVDNKGTT